MILLPQARGIIARRQVLDTLVRRDLRVRYAGSPVGYLWTILDPLAMALIYFVVFTFIFTARRVAYQPYVLFIVIGVLAWQWFSQCATETSRALLSESRLVRSTNLPRELWVVRIVVAKGIEFLLSLPGDGRLRDLLHRRRARRSSTTGSCCCPWQSSCSSCSRSASASSSPP